MTQPVGLAGRVFANGPGNWDSDKVILKTQKMVLDTSLLNTRPYKVGIKGKVEQSRERSSALPYTLIREPSGLPSFMVGQLYFLYGFK